MSNLVDKRGVLDNEVFTYQVVKDNRVFISYCGRQVCVLADSKAERFLQKIASTDGKDAQLIMAKLTGNFKRGSEKAAKLRKDMFI